MNLIFSQPTVLVLPLVIIAVVISFVFYRYDKALTEASLWIRLIAAFSRFIVVFVILLFFLKPLLKYSFSEVKKPILAVAFDNSQSMIYNGDSMALTDYYKALKITFNQQLKDKFELDFYSFGNSSNNLSDSFKFNELATDYSQFFSLIEKSYNNQNLSAVVLLSDGIVNKGKSIPAIASSINWPVYTIALGDTVVKKDIKISKYRANSFAYLGNQFVVEVDINATKLPGQRAQLSIINNGKILFSEDINVKGNVFSQTITAILNADAAGLQTYEMVISAVDGEYNLENNSQKVVIDILDARQKVLILTPFPHPDVGALNASIGSNENYEVDVKLIRDFEQNFDDYNLVIFYQLPSKENTEKQVIDLAQNAKVPILFIATPQTNLEVLANQSQLIKIKNTRGNVNEVYPHFNNAFTLFNLSDATKEWLSDLPPVKVAFGEYDVTASAATLLHQKIGKVATNQPLLVLGEFDKVKRAVWLSDGFWQWRMRNFFNSETHDSFNELISKIVQYLAVKQKKDRFTVNAPRILTENDDILFEAQLFNASFEPVSNANIKLEITDENNLKYDFTFNSLENYYRLNAGNFKAGDFQYFASCVYGEESFEQKGVFSIKEIKVEQINTLADFSSLEYLSKETGGITTFFNQEKVLIDALAKSSSANALIYTKEKFVELINERWLFAVLLLFLALEWILRKYNGAY